jgi:hypothetical protein
MLEGRYVVLSSVVEEVDILCVGCELMKVVGYECRRVV